jgi:hypothetical protein
MLNASGGVPPAPAGYTFMGTIVVLKNGALTPNALYTKK